MGAYCINKSGASKKVYQENSLITQIGTIYNNECFAWTDVWAGDEDYCGIVFRNSSGNLQGGWLLNDTNNLFAKFLSYSFGNVTNAYDGKTYKSFKTRKALDYYDASGNYKGTCTSGARVLTNDTEPGATNRNYMRAMYVESGVNTNVWIIVSGIPNTYGFIDTGLGSDSKSTGIGVYGNW